MLLVSGHASLVLYLSMIAVKSFNDNSGKKLYISFATVLESVSLTYFNPLSIALTNPFIVFELFSM